MAVPRKLAVPLWDALARPDRGEYSRSAVGGRQALAYDLLPQGTPDLLVSPIALELPFAHLPKRQVYS